MIPEELTVTDLADANEKGAAWCAEVNAQVHTEIAAVPADRLAVERDLLGDLPSLRARIGKVVHPEGRPAELCPVRLGPLLGADCPTSAARSSCVVANGTVTIVFLGEIIAQPRPRRPW